MGEMTGRIARLAGACAALAVASHAPQAHARGIQVNLTASWPSSPLFPLMEASEFLAEENPLYFWRYIDALGRQQDAIVSRAGDSGALSAFAAEVAHGIAPHATSMLELTIATRTYSAKVEMYRQLALDSNARVCPPNTEAWAVVYKEKHCVAAVACSLTELDAALATLTATSETTQGDVCVAAGINDVEIGVDHKYPHPSPPRDGTVILYGSLASDELFGFHRQLLPLAKDGGVAYILRHYPKDSTLETLLQGYGVSLDIKNMEYKTIDDSKKAGDGADEEEEEEEMQDEDDDDDNSGADDEIDGLIFSKLTQQFPAVEAELKAFRDQLAKQHDEADHEIKAWHLKDIGLSAAREILDAKNPLKRLRILSQDFPKHAKKLAFSRKPLSDELRAEIELRRNEASGLGLLNRFLVNGIPVDPMQRSFNIFDFVSTLKKEWSIAKKLAALPLTVEERNEMLSSIRESKPSQGAVRIRVRGPFDGVAPLYLNDIDSDHMTEEWPRGVGALRRPSWNLIFVRKNMYEYVVVFDPTTAQGRVALTQISFLRMRGAPLQWGMLISTKELLEAKTVTERDAIVAEYKKAEFADKATGWHFAKLLLMAKDKDAPTEEGATGRVVKGFIEGVAEETSDPTLQTLIDCYLDTTGGSFTRSKSRDEALEVLRSEEFDASVMAMTEMIGRKHLPFESTLFNGVLKQDLDLQGDIMNHFGRDQGIYQELAREGSLSDDVDLVDELLTTQDAYPAYFSIFSGSSSEDDAKDKTAAATPRHLFANDENAMLETLMATKLKFINQPGTATTPKKQTLLFAVDLSDPVHAAHVHRAFKAVQEDLGNVMQLGVIHRVTSGDEETVGDLVAAIIDTLGDSDEPHHLQLATEALACVAKGKTIDGSKSKLAGLIEKVPSWEQDDVLVQLKEALTTSSGKLLINDELRTTLQQLNRALDAAQPRGKHQASSAQLYLNGFRIELPSQPISDEDISALISYDMKFRSQPIAKAFIKRSATYTKEESSVRSMDIVKASAIVDDYRQAQRYDGINHNSSSIAIQLAGDESLRVIAYVDPLTEAAQRISSLLVMLHAQLNATIELFPLPAADYSEFPLQRFYRYLFDKKPASVAFRKLPVKPILTMKLDTPEAWNVQIYRTTDDLDNLRVDLDSAADMRATKSASFRVESLLVYGQCRDKTFDQYSPPNGLQLVLERDVGSARLHRDTLVMKNFGYFQLQATPGVWSLHLARGRAVDLYEIVEPATDKRVPSTDIVVSSFTSRLEQLLVQKRPGKEMEELLVKGADASQSTTGGDVEPIAEDAGVIGAYWKSMLSMFGKDKGGDVKTTHESEANASAVTTETSSVNAGRTGETIHVFSLATGHLYERFLKIMMLSVLKRTDNPVTFWLLENFLSPSFKDSIPALRETFGMDIRLVTYKWPNWLRQQTQKQRIIWGYKILFLDVLFPLGVQKIIYVDADQVVRADLKELWEMDLQGAPYGYTPFCDSRNVGFQFWRQGYWKDHLRGRPYHISALYVVDLALFRQLAAGDMLRAIYDQLSADPNSLSNLDQDLPNYAQHQIKIHSLPNEWLWCESWCSDESKATAKTIDLCNNPKHKEPKLDMAKRVIAGDLFPESWVELDQEIKDAEKTFVAQLPASSTA